MTSDNRRTIARALAVVLSAALAVIIGRAIGPQGRGLYVLPGMLAVLGAVAFSGLKTGISRTMQQTGERKAAVHAALLCCLPLGAIAGLGMTVVATILNQLWAVPYALAAMPFAAMNAIASGYGYGLRNVRIPNIVNTAVPAVTIVLVLSAFWIHGAATSMAIAMWLLAYVLTGTVSLAFVLAQIRAEPSGYIDFPRFLSHALRLSGLHVVQLLNYRVDLYIVALLTSVTMLGVYGVAVSGAEAMLAVLAAISLVSQPRIGEAARDVEARRLAKWLRNSVVISTAACAAAVLAAPYAVTLLFGREFSDAIFPLQILLAGIAAVAMGSAVMNYYRIVTGKPHVPFLAQATSTVTCAALSYSLVPSLGIVGAAVAATCSYVLSLCAALIWYAYEARVPAPSAAGEGKADLRTLLATSTNLWSEGNALELR